MATEVTEGTEHAVEKLSVFSVTAVAILHWG
jgi:hypothetical protein